MEAHALAWSAAWGALKKAGLGIALAGQRLWQMDGPRCELAMFPADACARDGACGTSGRTLHQIELLMSHRMGSLIQAGMPGLHAWSTICD